MSVMIESSSWSAFEVMGKTDATTRSVDPISILSVLVGGQDS